jgi:hypothetical protein
MDNLPLNLRLIKHCPVCQREYQQTLVQILSENEFGLLTHVTCAHCGAHLLTRLATMPQGVVGNSILTDLQADEVMGFIAHDEISAEDVLRVHQMLEDKKLINLLNN